MGTFLVNLHVRCESPEPIKAALRKLEATRAYVTQPKDGWISVYETRCCDQDVDWIKRVTRQISKAASSHAISFLIHDSDFLAYWLYDQGKLVDQYNSLPDCFEECSDAERKKLAGKPAKLQAACRAEVTLAQVEQVFARFQAQPEMPEMMLEELAKLLGIDANRAYADDHGIGMDVTAEEIEAELFKGGEADEDDEFGDEDDLGRMKVPPFVKAIQKNDVQRVAAFIEDGAKLNANVFMGQTPLHLAVEADAKETIQLLLKAGAQVNRRNAVGMTPLYCAMTPEIAQLLVDAGADVNAAADEAGSPLHYFVPMRNLAMVRFLVQAGADIMQRDRKGQTAYEAAVAVSDQVTENFRQAGQSLDLNEILKKLPPEHAEKLRQATNKWSTEMNELIELIRPKN
jgi:hypothetical protein